MTNNVGTDEKALAKNELNHSCQFRPCDENLCFLISVCSQNQKKLVPDQSALRSMLFYLSDNFYHGRYIRVNFRSVLLQTVWIQIRSNQLSNLIKIQTGNHSDVILERNL